MDAHGEMLLEQFHEELPSLKKLKEIVEKVVKEELDKSHIFYCTYTTRIKTEKSLIGKLELKGYKYRTVKDITDLLGARVVTYYVTDVDKIASIVEKVFKIDFENSIDKRKSHNVDQFGYMSLHYICYLPEEVYKDENYPEINSIPFELQMRTSLQDTWAQIMHDIGYKSDIEMPRIFLRKLNRLAGLLELADEEFSSLRTGADQYRKSVKQIVADGGFDNVDLDWDSFHEYIASNPFRVLNDKIREINNMDIQQVPYEPYYKVFRALQFKTLGDIERLRIDNEADAYQFALRLFGSTDIDIVASTVGVMCLCIVYLIKLDVGGTSIKLFLDAVNGERASNERIANRYFKIGLSMGLIKEKDNGEK